MLPYITLRTEDKINMKLFTEKLDNKFTKSYNYIVKCFTISVYRALGVFINFKV